MVDLAQSELYKNIPLGDDVAREFPWWREGQVRIPAGTGAFQEFRFRFGPNNAPCRSDREKPIKIHELRWIINYLGTRYPAGELLSGIQIFHSKYDIVNKWLPLECMNTEETRHIFGDVASAMFLLPAPYFLQRGQAFKIELLPINAQIINRDIDICLRGWDPLNKTPCVMNKVVALGAINTMVPVVFDENRDSAIRNMWVRDITFGFTDVDAASTPRSITDHLRVRFHAGMGPRWTDDEVNGTRLSGLVHDDSCLSAAGAYRPTVIHRPVTPYVLRPREILTIKIRPELVVPTQSDVWCWVIGTQEGRY